MPIECDIEIVPVSQDDFHRLDKTVMRCAFDIHNSMGRFLDEKIYQGELSQRCITKGIDSLREVEIRLSHGTFAKSYFIDMLVECSVIYELKAVDALLPTHQNQLINYLLLTDTRHGKLLNMRSASVQSRFVSTTLTRQDRMSYRLNADKSDPEDESADKLKYLLFDILKDWGIGFDLAAYRDALLHFTTGNTSGIFPVPIMSHGRMVGSQKMCLIDPETGWHLSAVRSNIASHEKHIRRLLNHTSLRSIHWINLNQKEIHFKTIINDSVKK